MSGSAVAQLVARKPGFRVCNAIQIGTGTGTGTGMGASGFGA